MQQKSIPEFLAGLNLTAITISSDGRVLLHEKEITAPSLELGLGSAAAKAQFQLRPTLNRGECQPPRGHGTI